ncbi:MAG TPA: Ig-like domain-containing protein [Bacteroidota bacterium]|nr:Ig-like domain-containing protein [Bacteroidota bacterium]
MVPSKHPDWRTFIGAGLACLLLAACAGDVPPQGGPIDRTSPAIVHTEPDTNAIRVRPRTLKLEFSKYVDRRTVEESVFISPYLGKLEYDWSGTEVEITFADTLRANTTYVVNVGTDVVDLRQGNRMAAGFTLAFSTGDSIDKGYISGRVFDEKPDGVMIFAYRLRGILPDTLNPAHAKPDYITQTGKEGEFVLAHLSLDPYRIFAIRDEYHNLLYDREIDQYGVGPRDYVLDAPHPRITDVAFRLTKEDTTRPFVSGVTVRDRYRLSLRFSEALDSASVTRATLHVLDTLTQKEKALRLFYQERMQPAILSLFLATPLDSPATYRVRATGVTDLAGNIIDSSARGEVFFGSLSPDTIRPGIEVREMHDSIRGISVGGRIDILFSDPPAPFDVRGGISLLDSSKRVIDAKRQWSGAASLALTASQPLLSKAWYTLLVRMDSLRSLNGLRYKDSTYRLRFQTMDLRTTGSISGVVVDSAGGTGVVFLTATSIDLTPQRSATVTLPLPGPFQLEQLVEGKYVVSAFRDSDGSGKYSYGSPSPFIPSERFAVYPDTIRVRARWGVEGLYLHFK